MGSTAPIPTDDRTTDHTDAGLPESIDVDPADDDDVEAALRQAIMDGELDDEATDAMTTISEAKYTFTCVCTCKCTLSC